ncbi:histidine--tRNA ligase [soil metagenome]
MKVKPSIPKGTRDFGPKEVYKRNYIFGTIRKVFQKFGYHPLETPTMENLETLTGKYGEEGDQLLFKVLDSGDFLKDVKPETYEAKDAKKLSFAISGKGLRYDLTIPFARYVVMNQNDITFPFKRYQIQPVWRADRPQKGRYREFYQCDADVVGTDSLLSEAELTQIYDEVFTKLGMEVVIKINSRKLLAGLAEVAGVSDQLVHLTVAIDKLDKIGIDGVTKELITRGINPEVMHFFTETQGLENKEKLAKVKEHLKNSEIGSQGVSEMETLFSYLEIAHIYRAKVEFDLTLARGLNYYTGTIFEVKALGAEMGSIGGGGRYDNLTGMFGLNGVSGVGVSFGAERIYDVLEELNLFPPDVTQATTALFINFGGEFERAAFGYLQKLHMAEISAEIYPGDDKMAKQMKYANAKNIHYVVFVGEEELKREKLTVKNMITGEQNELTIEQLIILLKQEA